MRKTSKPKTDNWQLAKRNLPIGRLLKNGAYEVTAHHATAIELTRTETGKTVRITKRKIETTASRLQTESIPFRGIDYTVAIETAIVVALGNRISIDSDNRQYTLN